MPHIEDAWVIQCGPEVGPRDEGLYHRRGAEGDANGYTSDLMSAGVWFETDARRIAGQRDVVVPLLDLLWKTDRNSVGGLLTLRALVNARDGDAWGEAGKRVGCLEAWRSQMAAQVESDRWAWEGAGDDLRLLLFRVDGLSLGAQMIQLGDGRWLTHIETGGVACLATHASREAASEAAEATMRALVGPGWQRVRACLGAGGADG